MELNRKSWHARLYKMHNTFYPESLCTYFWAVILYVVIFPLEMVSMFHRDLRESDGLGVRIVVSIVIWLILLTPLIDLASKGLEFTIGNYLYALFEFLCTVLIFMLTLISVLGIGYAGMKGYDKISNRKQGPTLVGEWWKGFKGKYCPKIDWK